MIRVMFKNLKRSDLVEGVLNERIEHVLKKFPEAGEVGSTVVVSKDHCKSHAGSDSFHVKVILFLKGQKALVLEKENSNVYQAVALIADRLFETLHRQFDRRRDHHRSIRRRVPRWSYSGL